MSLSFDKIKVCQIQSLPSQSFLYFINSYQNFLSDVSNLVFAIYGLSLGANLFETMDQRLFEEKLIPRMAEMDHDYHGKGEPFDFALIQAEKSLLTLAAGNQESVGVFYFLAYDSGDGRTFVR